MNINIKEESKIAQNAFGKYGYYKLGHNFPVLFGEVTAGKYSTRLDYILNDRQNTADTAATLP
jgi:hypothetical protein